MKISKENTEFIQSACNSAAVAKTLSDWIIEARSLPAEEIPQATKYIKAVIGKLCSMYGIEHGDQAYEYLTEI